jgi:hypothetical protein
MLTKCWYVVDKDICYTVYLIVLFTNPKNHSSSIVDVDMCLHVLAHVIVFNDVGCMRQETFRQGKT